jgi:chromosome segregation ATPase
MITRDNIDNYIASEIRNNMMISEQLESAKQRYEKLKGDLEDSDSEIKGLQERKESFKN